MLADQQPASYRFPCSSSNQSLDSFISMLMPIVFSMQLDKGYRAIFIEAVAYRNFKKQNKLQ
jgi:hypothetical protein